MLLVLRSYLISFLIGCVRTDRSMQEAIGAFAKAHSVNCHTLLFTYSNKFHEQRKLLEFHKAIISDNFIPTALENINSNKTSNVAKFNRIQCSRSLRSFIMGNVTYILEYMTTGRMKGDIKKDQWLIFITNDTVQELIISRMELSIRSEVYIARRVNDGFEFFEIYRPARNNEIRINRYGDWNTKLGLNVQQSSVLERRNDFGGAVLRAVKFGTKFDKILLKKSTNIINKVWHLLEKELNFTTEYIVVRNNSQYYSPEPLSDTITRMLARNEADVSLAGLSLKPSNLNDIDYSTPLFSTKYRVWVKEPYLLLESWWHMLHPFSPKGWRYLLLAITVIPIIIFLMFCISRKTGLIRTECNFLDLCVTVHQMLCSQGGNLQQELYSISLVFVSFNFWAFIIRAMYSAALASSLAIKRYDPPISSLTELLENGQYEFGIHRYSPVFDIYYNAENSFNKKLNKVAMDQNISNLPTTYLEGLQRVCFKKNYAFMANEATVSDLKLHIPCELHSLKNEAVTVSIAYAMSKHNVYLSFINRCLYAFNQFGLTSKLKRESVGGYLNNLNNTPLLKSIELGDTILLQILMLIGILLSVLILSAEIAYHKLRRHRKVNRR